MKIPKTTKRYCKFCKKHTEQKIAEVKGKERGSQKKGSLQRAYKRGRGRGFGNLGKYGSKPPISKWKRTGAKTSKKTNLKYTCSVCKKTTVQKKGTRTKKLVME
ncbi:MAG TPA: 50S ribosomal protein L44e [Candidatus Nanoarchaeia archaeon]|nr:50S ribosomal protein L44e [Candidatus Nanoarchaeia archaeon]